MPQFYDAISLERLEDLHPKVIDDAKQQLQKAWDLNLRVRITYGFRTFKQQQTLYNKGRTTKGKIVTNAPAGKSYHNYGLAIDFCLLDEEGKPVYHIKADQNNDQRADWIQVAEIFKAAGWEWGGDWKSLKDYPHLQKTFGYSVGKLYDLYQKTKKQYLEI